ncbi:MAG: serine O-acetyltransferase [Pseudomonadota bacterium]
MSQTTSAVSKIHELDPVWSRIRQEADDLSKADQSLGGFAFANVLNHETFEGAVSYRIAQRLDHPDMPADLLMRAFSEAIKEDPSIGDAMRADIVAIEDRDPACHRFIEPLLYFKGFQAVQTYRMGHQLLKMGRKDFAYYLQSRASLVFSLDIHPGARIGRGLMIDHAHAIVIGETAVIGDNVSLLHSVTLGGTGKVDGDRHPKVGSGVLIGAGASVLGNIKIGDCSRVAAGSVVLHDVPPNRTVAGVPAKIIGYAGCSEPSVSMNQLLPQNGTEVGDEAAD